MSIVLLEADFLTTNMKDLFKKTPADSETTDNDETDSADETAKDPETSVDDTTSKPQDWVKEFDKLKKRLEANKKLAPESQEKEYDIEKKFWIRFFKSECSGGNKKLAEYLCNLEQIKTDFKQLGFDIKLNPLYAFLKLKYVQTELLAPKLINARTYTAIHNTLAKQWMADSEFFKASEYNVLYCRDLYSKPTKDMQEYIQYQQKILPTNLPAYSKERQEKVISALLKPGAASMLDSSAKLKSLAEIEDMLGSNSTGKKTETSSNEGAEKTSNGRGVLLEIAAELDSDAAKAAALQFIGTYTGDSDILARLNEFNLDSKELLKATQKIASLISRHSLSKADAQELASML